MQFSACGARLSTPKAYAATAREHAFGDVVARLPAVSVDFSAVCRRNSIFDNPVFLTKTRGMLSVVVRTSLRFIRATLAIGAARLCPPTKPRSALW
jgi:hypothetical protein